MNSNMETKVKWIEVTGKGETKEKAIEEAFKVMRKRVGTDIKEPIIAMRTADVSVTDSIKEEKNEAFMLFFMKRKRVMYTVSINIKIEIDYVDFERRDRNA